MTDPLRDSENSKRQENEDAEAEFTAAADDVLQSADSDDTDDVFDDVEKFAADNNVSVETLAARTTYPLRRPHPDELFRVHPSDDMTRPIYTYRQSSSGKLYYVMPDARASLEGLYRISRIVVCCTGENETLVWAINMPREGSGATSWYETAWHAVLRARKTWVRIVSDKKMNAGAGGYDLRIVEALKREPVWPEESFQTILKKAFKGMVIRNDDHPIVKKINGEEKPT